VSFRLARGGHGPPPPIPAPLAGAFNALTLTGVQVKGEPTPLRAWESCPATAPPTPRHCATLCGVVNNCPVALYHPLPYGRHPAPSKKDSGTLEWITHNYSALTRDGAVTSGQWERSPPSPSALCGHPGHCTTIPDAVGHAATGHRHASHCTSYDLPSRAPSSRPAGGGLTRALYATTLEAVSVRAQDAP
jgi:hypothetical protein